ncbi:hypothetical protein P5673_006219 [Acropora cervicornis]|uniref:Uncharacterized protein n=1 Tax=Acropora cervicornis TaxID=6130 RepID=A0AAD9QXK5_ACRCE|nr:hypothetical protein P5673_006219 [Acropora cervicornis]
MKLYVALAALMLISTVMGSSNLMKKLRLISPENDSNKASKPNNTVFTWPQDMMYQRLRRRKILLTYIILLAITSQRT